MKKNLDALCMILNSLPEWEQGYLSGLLACLGLLLLVLFLKWIFFGRTHTCSGLQGNTAHGGFFVSARAISDLLTDAGAEIPGIRIRKVLLIRTKKECFVRVFLNYAAGPDVPALPEAVETYQANALSRLENMLQSTAVSRIEIRVVHAKR